MSVSSSALNLDISKEELAVQDVILQYISSNYVSLDGGSVKYFKEHLKNVTNELIYMMRREDALFNRIFQREHVAGSFWNNLKIGKPVEFDKNFVLYLPGVLYKNKKIAPASPSYVTVNVRNGLEALKHSKCLTFRPEWFDGEGNILSDKVRSWMEGVVNKAFARCLVELPNKKYEMQCGNMMYEVVTRKSGPATTIEVDIVSDATRFCIDLVPAFEFEVKDWPNHIKACPANAKDKPWHLVPKPLKPEENAFEGKIPARVQWRLSFHNQETTIIHNLYHFKAVLKLLKKLRDYKFDQYKMSSYALKTVFMLEIESKHFNFWQQQLSSTFLYMLSVLTKRYGEGKIPFYWDNDHNLLGKLSDKQIVQTYNTLRRMYNKIIYGLQGGDHFIIASSMLKDKELIKMQRDKALAERLNTLI